MSRDELPKGWQTLQERSLRERDFKKLVAIIDEMNRLPTEREKAPERQRKGNRPSPSARPMENRPRRTPGPAPKSVSRTLPMQPAIREFDACVSGRHPVPSQ